MKFIQFISLICPTNGDNFISKKSIQKTANPIRQINHTLCAVQLDFHLTNCDGNIQIKSLKTPLRTPKNNGILKRTNSKKLSYSNYKNMTLLEKYNMILTVQ